MRRLVSPIVSLGLRQLGLQLKPFTPALDNGLEARYRDLEEPFVPLHRAVQPYTMTSIDRQYNLYKAIQYVRQNKVMGDFVECGVFRGGSSMLAAYGFKDETPLRDLWLYDTYAGMTAPTEFDAKTGNTTAQTQGVFDDLQKDGHNEWCYAGIDEVKANMVKTGYAKDKLHFVQGNILETIPQTMPEKIAILRLDTDFYDSTKHELEHLYPRLVSGGVLIIDDYGSWQGAKKAVDEYFAKMDKPPFLARVDDTGRIAVKP